MATIVNLKVEIDTSGMEEHFTDLCNDKQTKLEVNNYLAKMFDPYVPMLHGPLHESGLANVTPEYIEYGNAEVPYARRQYYGVDFNHTIEKHPQATALWDEAMFREHGEEVDEQIRAILIRRYKELYG